MKITKLQTIIGHSKGPSISGWTFVRVHTDAGIVGLGEAGFTHHARTVKTYIEELEQHLVGRNPLEIEYLWQYMYRSCYERGGPVIMSAIGGIDMALWDIAGKHFGVPVSSLLGGRCRNKVRVYTGVPTDTPQETAERCRAKVNQGYTAVRLHTIAGHEDMSLAQLIQTHVDVVRAAREAVGDNVDVCIDIHRRLRVFEAIALAKELEPFHLLFMEDPIMPENVEAMAQVAQSTTVPIATGENLYTLYQFNELLAKKAARMLRVDLCLAGGITQARKIAALAEANFATLVPHQPLNPVATAAYTQFTASIPNLLIQEYGTPTPLQTEIVDQPYKVENGYLLLPDRCGIGIELNLETLKQYEYVQCDVPTLHRQDGSITDW